VGFEGRATQSRISGKKEIVGAAFLVAREAAS
jgi:hypothetical protein